MDVAVVGAGIGGLIAAIALRREGIEPVVYEQMPELRALGAGLHLWNNGVRALDSIGLGERVRAIGAEIEHERIYTARGRLLADWPIRELADATNAPSLCVSRAALLEQLIDESGHHTVQTGRRFVRFEDRGANVRLLFDDGTEAETQLLVGADGLGSTVRAQLFGAAEPRYAGYTSWRTIVPADVCRHPAGVVNQYWGGGIRFVTFPIGRDRDVYFEAHAKAPRGERDEPGSVKPSLAARFRGFPEIVATFIDAADEGRIIRTDIVDRDPIDTWGEGRVTLLGDAAHPMTPNTSQGAAMAIEDAAVLALTLGAHGLNPEALRQYERRRQPRANGQVKYARPPAKLLLVEHPVTTAMRDAFMRLTFPTVIWRSVRKSTAAEV